MRVLLPIIAVLFSVSIALAQNIYPDPSFEVTGEKGEAHSGERAMKLSVSEFNHFQALGGVIGLEPFAKYRYSVWAKGNVTSGQFRAAYSYEWDSYEWAFVSGVAVDSNEWKKYEVTVISPINILNIHPLSYFDSANSEAWVDDVVLEKIASPQQAMAELEAKTNPTEDDMRLLARWYAAHNQIAKADALMQKSNGLLHADIATVIAKYYKNPAQRRPYLVQMVSAGSPTYYRGVDTFLQLSNDFSANERFSIISEALKFAPNSERTVQGVRILTSQSGVGQDAAASLYEQQQSLDSREIQLKAILAEIPADSLAARELNKAMTDLTVEQKKMADKMANLGACHLVIGGSQVKRETHAIVVPDSPTPAEQYAARELRYHIELITGESLPIWYERDAQNATAFFVGKCRKTMDAGIDVDSLGLEGTYVKIDGKNLFLAGGQRGVNYAVYDFLENDLGCRWFTPDCATWPKTGDFNFANLDRRYDPPLEYRAGDYPIIHSADFATRCRFTGNVSPFGPQHGYSKGVLGLAHTFEALVPSGKYFAEHPEYFSEINGKRQKEYTQLCLTNPDVLKIAIEGVRQWKKDHPNHTVFSVSQNDWWNYCTCENCTEVAEEEGGQAGVVVRFCNAVAEALEDEYPDIAIETLAYQYTRKPPLVTKPRHNVIICLCSIECCFIHDLGTDEFNKTFVDDIKGWAKICDRLWIWDYVINYAHSICPFPNLYVLKPNINFFLNNGVTGIYEESCYYTKGSELQELRNYIIAKTLWEPNYDVDKAIDEFCAAFYGAAAPQVREYINLIHRETQLDPENHVTIYTHPVNFVTPVMIEQSNVLFDKAEAAVANDPTYLHRVQVARLPIMYAQITLASAGKYNEQDGALVVEGQDVSDLAKRFAEIARAEGVTQVREGGADAGLDSWLAGIPKGVKKTEIKKLNNGALELSILPDMGGRIWRMKSLATGRDLLLVKGQEGAWVPSEEGYEEYSESGYRSAGWNSSFKVLEQTEQQIVMEAYLHNGLRSVRKIELAPDKATVTITSTLTNTSDVTVSATVRTHPSFALSSTANARLGLLQADGSWKLMPLSVFGDVTQEKDSWFSDDAALNGAWAVVDDGANVAIINRVAPDAIDKALLNFNGKTNRMNLELFGKTTALKPGASVSLTHSYDVTTPDAI